MGDLRNPVYPGWNIEREIGRGSFGAVYEISRDVFGKKERAALKCISIPENDLEIQTLQSDGHSREAITAHFENHLHDVVSEYSVMVDLKSHPNVVYCDDLRYVQHEDGIGWDIFIKMELLTPLKQYVKSYYSESDTLKLGKDLCSALVLCRQKNIIHRDIKPENIFVSETGIFKLGDFGVAKVTDKTASGTKIGTFEYMAPEVYNNHPYSYTADIYAVGLVMYWMMNGKRTPFLPLNLIPSSSEKEEARKRRFSGEKLPAPANGSPALKEIVLKACAFDPKERYRSAEEMLQALRLLEAEEANYDSEDTTIGIWSRVVVPNHCGNTQAESGDFVSQGTPANSNVIAPQSPKKESPPNQTHESNFISHPAPPFTPPVQQNSKKSITPLLLGIIAVLIFLLVIFIPKSSGNSTGNPSKETTVAANKNTPAPTNEPAHEHQWKEATYNAPKTCVSCGTEKGTKKVPSSSYNLRDIISYSKASSTYSGDNLGTHSADNLYDGKLQENWTENDSGNGVGEYVTFYLQDTYAVKDFSIYNGSHYNQGVYKENCRPKTITLTFSDGSSERISLADKYDEQTFSFDQYHYTDYVKLTIDEVYTGTKYLDTVIAELDFVAYRP